MIPERFRNAAGGLLLVLAVCTAFWQLVFTRQYSFLEAPDIANQVLPWLQVQARALREGTIALWDPYLLAGQPLVGQLQPGVTSPLTYLLLLAPLRDGYLDPYFINYWYVAMHVLAALFAYWMFLDCKFDRVTAVAASLYYAIGGYVGNTTWPSYLNGAVWFPLVALFLMRAIRGRRPVANASLAGLFLGLCWLAGHHQVPLFATLAALCLMAAARLPLKPCAVLLVTMALVSAVQVLPAMEYGRASVRWVEAEEPVGWGDPVPYFVHERNALGASDLLYLIFPGAATIVNPFAGVVALSLAFFGATTGRYSRAFLWLAGGSLLFALARNNPFHGVAYALLPMLDKARSPAVALCITHFALAVLAGFGLQTLLHRRDSKMTGRAAAGLALFSAALILLLVFQAPFVKGLGPDRVAWTAFISLLLAGVYWHGRQIAPALCALLILEHGNTLNSRFRRLDDRQQIAILPRLTGETHDLATFLRKQPDPKRVEIHYDDVLFNFGAWHGIETLSGYLPGVLAPNHKLTWWEPRILSMYGVGYAISRERMRPEQTELMTGTGGFKLFANPDPMPRAWSVHKLQPVLDLKQGAELVRTGSFRFADQAVIVGAAPHLEQCDKPDTVTLTGKRIHEVRLQAVMGCRGLVILAESSFPGWQALIDGRSAPIYDANTALRSVVVEAGTHEIAFRYRPWTVFLGLLLTLMGVASALAAALYSERGSVPAGDSDSGIR